jgi:outer membrane murein-binding lipoprotein Lpp
MKRVIAVLFVIALAFTMVSGCASVSEVKKLQADTQAALDRAQMVEQKCAADAQAAAASARRADDAANKAEAMANKCESIFLKHMKK